MNSDKAKISAEYNQEQLRQKFTQKLRPRRYTQSLNCNISKSRVKSRHTTHTCYTSSRNVMIFTCNKHIYLYFDNFM